MSRPALLATRGSTDSRRAGLVILAAVGLSIAVALGLLVVSGQLKGGGPFASSALVRYGLPLVRAVHDLAAALTVGLLAVGTWCLAPERGAPAGELTGLRLVVIRRAAIAAAVWLAASLTFIVLTAADVSGIRITDPGFGWLLVTFVGQIDLGRALGVSALLILVVFTFAITATQVTTAAWGAALSLVAVLPIALAGHSAVGSDHMNAVDSLAIHLVGVCLWVGGLGALVLIARRLGDQLQVVVTRYSSLALWCFVAVAASGVINALLRLGSLRELASGYGLLVLGKTAALGLLGLAGLAHRTRTIRQLPDRPRLFLRLAAVEVMVMGATIGLAVALSRSAPPASGTEVDPVALLLGFPPPPPLTVQRYVFSFYPDVLWLTIAGLAAALYVAGVIRLRRRGDSWPWSRLVSWLAGCVLLVLMTSGGPAIYGRVHFSTHMLQHMVLMMGVPLLWVLGAPVTLALRALRPRTDGSLGARETLLQLLHSTSARFLGNPITAELLFIASLVIFYYTSALRYRHVHPRGPCPDDRPLLVRRISVHLVHDRRRSGRRTARVPLPGTDALRDAQCPRLLRRLIDVIRNVARSELLACDRPDQRRGIARGPTAWWCDRLGLRRHPVAAAGRCPGLRVVARRPAPGSPAGPAGRAGQRR